MGDNVKILEESVEKSTSSKIISYSIEAAVILLALILVIVVRFTWLETSIVISGSMAPTLNINDRLIIDHRSSLKNSWKRSDIVVFEDPPNWEPDYYIKRIIAMPGDVMQIAQGKVYVNRKLLEEPYLKVKPFRENYGPWKIPQGYYFVMGDNRNKSEDSRDFGVIPESSIKGRAVYKLWPWGSIGK